MGKEDKDIEIDQYLDEVKIFKETTPKEAEKLIEAKEGNVIYIGQEKCPYCRKFVKKLSSLSKEYNFDVYYVHSEHPMYEEEIQELRDKYDVPTTPGLIYSSESAGIVVKCDSSLEEEEILEIIERN